MSDKSELAKFKESYPEATSEDLERFKVAKQNLFKGTIAVCVIYGVFALALLLLTLFYQPARNILGESMLTFVATLVGGMIFIIIILVIQVVTFKPLMFSKDIYDADMCPDYWKLQKLSQAEMDALPQELAADQKMLMSYKCVPDTDIIDYNTNQPGASALLYRDINRSSTGKFYVPLTGELGSAEKKMANDSSTSKNTNLAFMMSGDAANKNNLYCDVVYPNLLAATEKSDPDLKKLAKSNSLRCAYAKLCNVPWTSACPEKETNPSTVY